MFPRMSKANIGCSVGEAERTALARDWTDSFRALFQVIYKEKSLNIENISILKK